MIRELNKLSKGFIDNSWLHIPYNEITVADHQIRFVESNRLSTKRVQTLFTKEPTTIPWLESFQRDELFLDIGANVGMYSVYAAIVSGAKVYSFEPEALNFAELNKNIFINGLHDRIIAYCVALNDTDEINHLLLGGFAEGLSHHDFGENTWKEDKDFGAIKTNKDSRLRQGSVSYRLDSLIDKGALAVPQHIKIDVDGLEWRIVNSSKKTFESPQLKSVLIEIDHRIPECLQIVEKMTDLGWRYSMEQLRANRKVIFSEAQIKKMQQSGKGGLNYIFFKDHFFEEIFEKFLSTYTPPWSK